jgi:phosphate starvation-inducible PhoH-like protein
MDESQNTTVEQMKMVLTRIGFGSQAVINGDLTQIDLPKHITSGLDHVIYVLKETDGIGITRFSSNDVVRHPLVRKIIDAYKKFELNITK